MFSKRNDIHPFEDFKPLEFLALKNNAAFFVLGNHSKKRPHNLTIARLFDGQLLDMLELGINDISFMDEFTGPKTAMGNRPLMLFNGIEWSTNDDLITMKSLFLDLFSGDTYADQINLQGVSHAITMTYIDSKIMMRTYHVVLMKSGVKLPRIELQDMGPHFDFSIRRHMPANSALLKEALRIPKELLPKKKKNVSVNDYGEKVGRLWVDKQDMGKLQTRKMKGLKKRRIDDAESAEIESKDEGISSADVDEKEE